LEGEDARSNNLGTLGSLLTNVVRVFADYPELDNKLLSQLLPNVARKTKSPVVRRDLASLAVRVQGSKGDLLRELLKRKNDASDPIIPQLLWTAYEPGLAAKPKHELIWLKDNAPGNALITDTIVPRAMRRLVATGKPDDLGACVAFVGDLTDSGVRHKALDALVSAIGNRTVDEPKEWKTVRAALAKDTNPEVGRLTNSLAVKFRDPEAVKAALAIARDSKQNVADRIRAVRDLAVARDPNTLQALSDLARKDGPAELRAEAIRALAGFDARNVSRDLLAGWSSLPTGLRSEVVNLLAGRKEWAADLLAAVGSKTVDRRDLNDNTILRMQALNDRQLNAQIEKVWGRMRSTPAELAQLIDKMRRELDAAPGSFNRGKLVFDNQCAKCHKFDGRGHPVGPDIEGAGRDIEYLLTNVLDPNRVIGAPYFMRTVNLLNGRVETGVLHAEDGQSITLKTENGVLKQIQRADIDDVKVQEKSLMPEGLGNNMSVQDFRDLVRYTMANPFITRVEPMEVIPVDEKDRSRVKAARPEVGVTGRLTFPFLGDKPMRVVIDAKVIAPEDMTVRLLVGSRNDYTASVGEGQINGKGSGTDPRPDQSAVEMKLKKGENGLRVVTTYQGRGQGIYLRFHDPDRKLRYPDVAENAPKN
jgi:putative heme-binding domain-containing protein